MMNKDIEKMHRLLDKFYAGETDEGEEALLADFFATHRDLGEMETDRIIFGQLYGAMPENAPEGLEERLERHIDCLAEDGKRQRQGLTLWIRRYVMSAAAAVMVCCITGTMLYKAGVLDNFPPQHSQAIAVDTYDNPQMAAQATEMALLKFSKALNKGLKPLQ